jgi:hypothetical protein
MTSPTTVLVEEIARLNDLTLAGKAASHQNMAWREFTRRLQRPDPESRRRVNPDRSRRRGVR